MLISTSHTKYSSALLCSQQYSWLFWRRHLWRSKKNSGELKFEGFFIFTLLSFVSHSKVFKVLYVNYSDWNSTNKRIATVRKLIFWHYIPFWLVSGHIWSRKVSKMFDMVSYLCFDGSIEPLKTSLNTFSFS